MLKRFKKLSRSRQLVIAAAVLGFVAVGLSGGCIAYRRPPAFNAEERALSAERPPAILGDGGVVGRGHEDGAEPRSLWWCARPARHGQRSVQQEPVRAVVDANGPGSCGHFNGLVLQHRDHSSVEHHLDRCHSHDFSGRALRGDAAPEGCGPAEKRRRPVEVRYKGLVIMGWVAVVVGTLPGWSHGSADTDSRFAERFRLAVIRRRADIERLVRR